MRNLVENGANFFFADVDIINAIFCSVDTKNRNIFFSAAKVQELPSKFSKLFDILVEFHVLEFSKDIRDSTDGQVAERPDLSHSLSHDIIANLCLASIFGCRRFAFNSDRSIFQAEKIGFNEDGAIAIKVKSGLAVFDNRHRRIHNNCLTKILVKIMEHSSLFFR